MKADFKVGELVWARMKNYPVWPARIEPQPEQGKKGHVYVFFFGAKTDEQYGWVSNAGVTLYDNDTKAKLSQASTKADFKLGVEQIEAEFKKSQGETGEDAEGKGDEETVATGKRVRQPKKKFDIEKDDENLAPASAVASTRKRKATTDSVENGTKQYKVAYLAESMKKDVNSKDDSNDSEFDETSIEFSAMPQRVTSNLTIGFLGLGIMSTNMVNNLLKTGYKLNLWSRDNDKCYKLKEKADEISQGRVIVCVAPCDVMKESDIVFSCSSDPETAKKNVFDNCGVIHESDLSLDGKGFVEMTGIDPQTSIKLAEAIQEKGGRYLEAQLQGSREEAQNGTLIILAAGDNSLFADCQGCFEAIGKTSLHLGPVGSATKVHLILQIMQGCSLVGLAEGLTLAERLGISGKDVVEIFSMTSMASPFMLTKANKILDKDFKQVDQSVKNMQKDLRLALGMSEDLMQPLMIASAANEIFKHSRKLGYDDLDCSCIYMRARY